MRIAALYFYALLTPPSVPYAALLTGSCTDGCHLRLGSRLHDLDVKVEIEFSDSIRSLPTLVTGGKSGQSAHHRPAIPFATGFGYGVYLGRWRRDAKLKPEQGTRVAVKVMHQDRDRNNDCALSTPQ